MVVYPQYGIIHGEGLKYGIHGFSCLGRTADGGIMCYTNVLAIIFIGDCTICSYKYNSQYRLWLVYRTTWLYSTVGSCFSAAASTRHIFKVFFVALRVDLSGSRQAPAVTIGYHKFTL